MPRIRDGSNRVTEFDMGPPPTIGAGPVERDRVSDERMADFAAERAAAEAEEAAKAERRAARRLGRTPAAVPEPDPSIERAAAEIEAWLEEHKLEAPTMPVDTPPRTPTGGAAHRARKLPKDREERYRVVIEAVRLSKSHAEAGAYLGVSGARVEQLVVELRRNGQLPADVDAQLRARSGYKVPKADRTSGGDPGIARPRRGNEVAPPEPSLQSEERASEPAVRPPDGPDVILPCEGCLHAPVCSIKADLERWVGRARAIESPHPAIAVAAISISCAYELQATP